MGYDSKKAMTIQEKMIKSIDNRNFGDKTEERFQSVEGTKTARPISIEELYAAPTEWNFYEPLDDTKFYEMLDSIRKCGLINPIIIWRKNKSALNPSLIFDTRYELYGKDYMILSGHNRARAYYELYKQTGDERYARIPALIYEYINNESIDEAMAQYLIVASNYVQRALSVKEKRLSISYMYTKLSVSKRNDDNIAQIIAEQIGISKRQVMRYNKLNNLIEPLIKWHDTQFITQTSALILADLEKSVQIILYSEYQHILNNKTIKKIKTLKLKNIENIKEAILEKDETYKIISVKVPSDLEVMLKEHIKYWVTKHKKNESKKIS